MRTFNGPCWQNGDEELVKIVPLGNRGNNEESKRKESSGHHHRHRNQPHIREKGNENMFPRKIYITSVFGQLFSSKPATMNDSSTVLDDERINNSFNGFTAIHSGMMICTL